MKTKEHQFIVIYLTLCLLVVSFTCASPRRTLVDTEEKKSGETNSIEPRPSRSISKLPEFQSKPSKKSKNTFDNPEDFVMYHENRDDGSLKCLCWAEIFIIKENNRNNQQNLTNELAIILKSPVNIVENVVKGDQVEEITLFDTETNQSRTLNFTVTNKTRDFTIKEHKTVHCGSGPILLKTYIEWPKINKQKIEIRLTPLMPSKWKIYTDDATLDTYTVTPSYQTFDTTNTESYFPSNLDEVTISMSKTEDEGILTENSIFRRTNKHQRPEKGRKINGEPVLASPNVKYHTHKGGVKTSKSGLNRELLTRNLYFKKLSDTKSVFNMTAPSFFADPKYDTALHFFDLIYPNKSALLRTLKGKHKFLINIDLTVTHIVVENVNGTDQEVPESEMELREENVYRFKN